METKEKKRKKTAAVTVAVLSATIALTGTYAWTSISQEAVNEQTIGFNPGGRLHDDYDGLKKSVYVENYTDPEDKNSSPIFVRIRLLEYMETGADAGKNREQSNENRGEVIPVITGAEISDPSTWKVHIPEDLTDPFHEHWTLGFGGSTSYMPTFNKDKDSLVADINGTLEGNVVGDKEYYDDYIDYAAANTPNSTTETADYGNGNQILETHEVTVTQDAEVITMEQWQTEKDSKPGKYWVWDTDGWAYWAEALQPGTATGLLLNKVMPNTSVKCYYSIYVENQQASAGDWGTKGTGVNGTGDGATGFYVDGMTEEALELLKTINVVPDVTEQAE